VVCQANEFKYNRAQYQHTARQWTLAHASTNTSPHTTTTTTTTTTVTTTAAAAAAAAAAADDDDVIASQVCTLCQ